MSIIDDVCEQLNNRTMCVVRGFKYVKRYLDECGTSEPNVNLPERSTAHSAGYDFVSPKKYVIYPKESVKIPLGVKAYMLENEYLALYVRSSLGIKKGLMLMNTVGIIDSDYYNNPDNEGEIIACLYNTGDDPVTIEAGERIVQGIFNTYLVTDQDAAKRYKQFRQRTGGIGSTTE